MIGSAKDGKSMAVEAMRGHSAFYSDNDPVEAAATCKVGNPTERKAGTCGSGFHDVPEKDGHKQMGYPLTEAVWRSNHAVDPVHLETQEPLFNDTAFRYMLLHDLIQEHATQGVKMSAKEAISIASALGIKGPNFLTCDQQGDAGSHAGSNVLSAVYEPELGAGSAYVAWEDGTGDDRVPAACTSYVHFDFRPWWGTTSMLLV